jgi:superfamily I DNA/RNA helicase
MNADEAGLFNEIRDWKVENDLYTFEDILDEFILKLQDTGYREALQKRYREIIVDEAQDTNGKQLAILEALLTEDTRLIICGDICQTLYIFAGATPFKLIEFTEKFDFEVRYLSSTFRFGSKLSKVAQRVVDVIDIEDVYKIQTIPSSNDTKVEFLTYDEDFYHEQLAFKIKEKVDKFSPNEVAFIGRTNKTLDFMNMHLLKLGVPVNMKGGSLLNRKEVGLLFNVIQNLNRFQFENLSDLFQFMGEGINKRILQKVVKTVQPKKTMHLFEALENTKIPGIGPGRLFAFRDVHDRLLEATKVRRDDHLFWTKIAKAIQIDEMDFMMGKDERTGERIADKRWETIDFLNSLYRELGDGDPLGFINRIQIEFGPNDDKEDYGVSLMTVHGAKGLTLPHTFLSLKEFLSPYFVRSDEDLQSELFCLYVGLTRARDSLTVISSSDSMLNFIKSDAEHKVDYEELINPGRLPEEVFLLNNRGKDIPQATHEINEPVIKKVTEKAILMQGYYGEQVVSGWVPLSTVKVQDGELYLPKWVIAQNIRRR